MDRPYFLFTSESVSEGHPDKICDRISDEVVDLFYREAIAQGMRDNIRLACEAVVTTNKVILVGETRGPSSITKDKIEEVVRSAIKDIGYEQDNFNWRNCEVNNFLHAQSPDIAKGVDSNSGINQNIQGAGDQGIMFGYACRETSSFMPAAIFYAHRILRLISDARRKGEVTNLGPDAKCQVTIIYKDGVPVGVKKIVVSHQHTDENMSPEAVKEVVAPYVYQAFPKEWHKDIRENTIWFVNPTGKFYVGGPDGDSGLTGRKIIVDTYGGAAPHGGGAFSGKDPSKVDRSAAYIARYLAKNIVAAGLAEKCTIQLSYAIGIAEPLSIYVNTHNSGIVSDIDIEKFLKDKNVIDLTPSGICRKLALNNPIYAKTTSYGHFGREPEKDGSFSWEKTDFVNILQKEFSSQVEKFSSFV